MEMKFNIGDRVKTIQYPGLDDIRGPIIDARVLGLNWICKIQTDNGLRMLSDRYLEIDKEWYRDQKIDSILTQK